MVQALTSLSLGARCPVALTRSIMNVLHQSMTRNAATALLNLGAKMKKIDWHSEREPELGEFDEDLSLDSEGKDED